ncbi:winged helix-turn-helix transcriptional regulator [Sphingopyxis sp.]|uniref:winged helix-turn-helix transcriptional regulator n=1 Tax=Sphingopyxis sp. TaxID=1908224 RepID=UPI0039C9985E
MRSGTGSSLASRARPQSRRRRHEGGRIPIWAERGFMPRGGVVTDPRPSPRPAACDDHAQPSGDPLDGIEGRWTLQILLCLNVREHRFSDLRAAIPRVSPNILTDRLRALESVGLIERRHLPLPHASRVYMLASLAAGLRPALDALASWRAEKRNMLPPAECTGRS